MTAVLETTCEYAVDPLGIDQARPRFTWILESDRRGQVQAAYQVLVASSPTTWATRPQRLCRFGRFMRRALGEIAPPLAATDDNSRQVH